jgi:hypothetical protein
MPEVYSYGDSTGFTPVSLLINTEKSVCEPDDEVKNSKA